jgi:acyl-CoA thioesterase FadM
MTSWTPAPFRCRIDPLWIDYNGHLRDAYYGLIGSLAVDALMDELGIDERYRTQTRCTLYTLEMHVRYLHEVKSEDELNTHYELLGFDAKRLHLLLALHCARYPDPAAVIEVMLLHVRQDAEPHGAKLPELAMQRLNSWQQSAPAAALQTLGSRQMMLARR